MLTFCRRKGLGEQVQEKVTPQSQKSTGQVIGENLTGAGDKLAGAVQPSKLKLFGIFMNTFLIPNRQREVNHPKGWRHHPWQHRQC